MARFVKVPLARLEPDTLTAMLEDFASRDGTDYGLREHTLEEKVDNLRRQLDEGELSLVFELETEHWDLCSRERVREYAL